MLSRCAQHNHHSVSSNLPVSVPWKILLKVSADSNSVSVLQSIAILHKVADACSRQTSTWLKFARAAQLAKLEVLVAWQLAWSRWHRCSGCGCNC